ncbi:hypothetical protein ASG31_04965 [Chryseobacterium sp. Leaf404]|nr:hypothetical protein ASG31_04965 [Chryseobacterium sp. Leaf404]
MIMITSCVSTKVSSETNFDYSVLQQNTNYIIETRDYKKIRQFKFVSQTKDSIIGKQKDDEIKLNKNKVLQIKKPSTGKTVGLVVGILAAVGLAGFIPAAVSN